MRKQLWAALIVGLFATVLSAQEVAEEFTKGLAYTEINGGTELAVSIGSAQLRRVCDFAEPQVNLVIPATYRGKKVTKILPEGFSGSYTRSFILPDTITEIGEKAFYSCNLINVVIPASVQKIGAYAFSKNDIRTVNLPDGLQEIGEGAFAENSINELVLPRTITAIPAQAFFLNRDLTKVTVNCASATIGESAFAGCPKITSLTFNGRVTKIDRMAFVELLLDELVLPEGLEEISMECIHFGMPLKKLVFPSTLKSIKTLGLVSANPKEVVFLSKIPPVTILSSAEEYAEVFPAKSGYTYEQEVKDNFPFNTQYLQKVTVPQGSLDAYGAAPVWGKYYDWLTEASE